MQIQTTKMKRAPFSDLEDTASFSIGIAIEFIIISALSLFACLFDWYFLWFGLFFGFTLHLIVHCFMTVQFKHYVPGVVTCIPFLPICIYILWISSGLVSFTVTQLVLSCVIGSLLMLLMVSILHRCMKSFERLVRKFEG